jgi:hypothetical protein
MLRGVWVFLMRLRDLECKEVKLRLCPKSKPYRENQTYSVTGLLSWAGNEAKGIAEAFDWRNGNESATKFLSEHECLLKDAGPQNDEVAGEGMTRRRDEVTIR